MTEDQSALAPFRHHRAAQPRGRMGIVIARDPEHMHRRGETLQHLQFRARKPGRRERIMEGIAQRDHARGARRPITSAMRSKVARVS